MHIIFLYWPPAAWKLTVAKELAKRIGYNVFHNHLTVDLLKSVFNYGEKPFSKLNSKIRFLILEEAFKDKIKWIIMTFCYVTKKDERFVKKLLHMTQKHQWKIDFINLYCSQEELYKRVKSNDRLQYNKIMDKKVLQEYFIDQVPIDYKIDFVDSMSIDNTDLPPTEVAHIIEKRLCNISA